ncbi:MAG: magnesium transporter [Bryobacteraceae bacterium]
MEPVEASRTLSREPSAEEFLDLSTREQLGFLLRASEAHRKVLLRILPPDDAADLIQLAPEQERGTLLAQLDELSRREVKALLAYKEDVAGGLMNPRFARLRPQMTVDEAISYLRRQAGVVDSIYYAYALDEEQHLLGVVTFRDLFAADRTKHVRDIMRTNFVSASEHEDQEALARLFRKYHLLAIPVLDAGRRMQGVVTADDIVEVVAQEAGEDIQKIGGMEALEGPYLQIRFGRMVKSRAGWLTILFLGEMLTATAMGHFEHEIARAVVLALFVPLIISSGGNSGSQATTLVIRAMALGEVRLGDWFKVIYREASVGVALGVILAVIGMMRIVLWQAVLKPYGPHYTAIGLTVACSLIGVVLFGTFAGSMLPFVLRRAGLDPASASAPFVATLVDVTGLVIYFTIASVVLRGTLL